MKHEDKAPFDDLGRTCSCSPDSVGTASAQTTYGLIEGRITDATGGALPGATITVTQPTTGFVRTVVSNELGLYRVLNLHPAEYDVTVELSGFATVTCGSVKIDVGQAVALNVGMEVASLAVAHGRRSADANRQRGDPGDQQHDRHAPCQRAATERP